MKDSYQIRADLIPFQADYATTVRSWIDSPETLSSLCRSDQFPPEEDIVESWQKPDMSPYLLISERKPVAYGELWKREEEYAMEIVHLLVDPRRRNHGFGSHMLELLYDRAARQSNVMKVVINLFDDSGEALGCYVKAGFEIYATAPEEMGLKMIRLVR